MARSEPEAGRRAMTDEEYDELRETLRDLRKSDREYLAEKLGGEPDDYRSEHVIEDDGTEK